MPKRNLPNARVIGRGTGVLRRETFASLSREIGPVVYFIRTNDGLIKIGHTGDLAMRKRFYHVDWTNLLAVIPGPIEVEQALHERFVAHRARGHEYYHPVPELLAYINEVRQRLGVSLVAWAAGGEPMPTPAPAIGRGFPVPGGRSTTMPQMSVGPEPEQDPTQPDTPDPQPEPGTPADQPEPEDDGQDDEAGKSESEL